MCVRLFVCVCVCSQMLVLLWKRKRRRGECSVNFPSSEASAVLKQATPGSLRSSCQTLCPGFSGLDCGKVGLPLILLPDGTLNIPRPFVPHTSQNTPPPPPTSNMFFQCSSHQPSMLTLFPGWRRGLFSCMEREEERRGQERGREGGERTGQEERRGEGRSVGLGGLMG